jgi:hypothetical protein
MMAGMLRTARGNFQEMCCAVKYLVRSLVVAGVPAGLAIHETIGADANVDKGLAETAEFLAFAAGFGLLALCATTSCRAGSGTHTANVTRSGRRPKMT